ncbi:MAG: glycerol acyltransferase [Anaerolineaceae bacterium]|nr:MAG: glycerol acyltransferase [Anaerolineaceae bacterium]
MRRRIAALIVRLLTAPFTLLWRLSGWRGEGQMPDVDKFVMIAVPHTSNWDFFHMIPLAIHFKRRPMTLIKSAVFRWPLIGWLVRRIGGIAVDRSRSSDFVNQAVEVIAAHERFVLVVAPESTRSRGEYWRSGFYYIALKAGIPIVPGYLDYRRKVGGVGPALYPSGDIEADIAILRRFYAGYGHGKYPDQATPVRVKR